MKKLILFVCFIITYSYCFSQHHEDVIIIQKSTKHHIKLFAVNHTQNSKKILVELEANGFRRKSFKPIYKTINANDTLLLTTLVKRSNVGLKLNYELYYDSRLELYQLQQSKKRAKQKKRT
jgi:tRNA1(Val) A37 N6-methylase TrmN6